MRRDVIKLVYCAVETFIVQYLRNPENRLSFELGILPCASHTRKLQ